jgi:hypothetical protein
MDYSLEILRAERDKLREDFEIALNKEHKEPKDWDVICRNERLLEDLNLAIDLLFEAQFKD